MQDFRMETFLTVCELLNYTRAAEALHITQPAVSQHIRCLEEYYGVKLFRYEGKRLRLTEAGALLRNAATTMKHDEIILRELLASGDRPRFAFGATLTIGDFVLPPKLARYLIDNPEADVRMAVNMGGDDFLSKPFELSVLTAKVQALLRRTYDFGPSAHLLECGGAVLNASDGTLRVGDQVVELTRNEWKILQLLMENRGKTVNRDALMIRLWESDAFVDENTLTVNITRLRKKLDSSGLADFIRTKKGLGYMVG